MLAEGADFGQHVGSFHKACNWTPGYSEAQKGVKQASLSPKEYTGPSTELDAPIAYLGFIDLATSCWPFVLFPN